MKTRFIHAIAYATLALSTAATAAQSSGASWPERSVDGARIVSFGENAGARFDVVFPGLSQPHNQMTARPDTRMMGAAPATHSPAMKPSADSMVWYGETAGIRSSVLFPGAVYTR